MPQTIKVTLCLITIFSLTALVQTADYHDQQQLEVPAPSSHYLAWRDEMLKASEAEAAREKAARTARIAKWSAENPDLAPIINTGWREPKSQKVASK